MPRSPLQVYVTASWAALLGLSCGGAASDPEAHERHTEQSATESAHAVHAADTLHIDPSMLRDLRLTIASAAQRPLGEAVTALGDLKVSEDAYAEIGSPVPARVVRLRAAPGDTVRAGTPLIELASVSIGSTRALTTTTQARRLLARQKMARLRELSAQQIVPDQELRMAEAELAEADAEAAAARGAMGALGARGNGASLTLVSPIAGTIIERSALRGRLVDAADTLFVVGDLSRLWLIVHAFERDALRVRPGARARVSFYALPGQTFEGEVTRVASRVDPVSRTLDVRIELANPEGLLRPGMSGSASIPIGDASTKTITVPIAALQRLGDDWCVFVPGDDAGHFQVRPVGRGRDLSGEVELLHGLAVGEKVVVDGAFLLKVEADKARGGGAEHSH